MSLWADQVVPRLNARLNSPETRALRRQACKNLTGDVLEIGFGPGLSLAHYPTAVTRVTAVEPSLVAQRLAARHIAVQHLRVRFEGHDAAQLPFADNTFDAALSILTMCTIENVEQAAAEAFRVLKPGASLHFVEHGRAAEPSVFAWQRRMEPMQKAPFAGCHLTRDVPRLLQGVGFVLMDIEAGQLPGPSVSRPWTYVYQGVARKADADEFPSARTSTGT